MYFGEIICVSKVFLQVIMTFGSISILENREPEGSVVVLVKNLTISLTK